MTGHPARSGSDHATNGPQTRKKDAGAGACVRWWLAPPHARRWQDD